ncbi:2-dehydropantoate 2-reductase [Lentzea sp. NBRC 105346]|nr:2-dehydropantoate 2-reductase [Lentzea sp. NBRC 105346]
MLGPGGVGGVLAARLGIAGHDVTVIATDRTAAEITARGLSFTAPDGEHLTFPEARPWLTKPVDVLFIAVKATDLLPALQRVAAGFAGTVVPLLNGVDHMPLLRATHPKVVAASIAVEAARHRPGVIEQLSVMCDVVVADEDVAVLLRDAGFRVSVAPDDDTVLWGKLSFLAPFALVTTGVNAPLGEARTSPWLRPLIDETAAAAATRGVEVDADVIEARLRAAPEQMKSSMLRDREAGRPLELDAIAGPVIRALGTEKAATTVEVVRAILG